MNLKRLRLLFVMCIGFVLTLTAVPAHAETIYDNRIGTHSGYDFELWKDYGNTSMTLNNGGAFSASWNNIGNALFRKGKRSLIPLKLIINLATSPSTTTQPLTRAGIPIYVSMAGHNLH
ncbi:hypothetical protein BsIDN1_36330 [Bacillus safensis]|uniref:GH11 domain-containing protein n=1 Tax=Bacillus safensis TaxID=561879 RepID=A0A5S9MAW1_BACIA|nr:hypothetical protein BsIDN1_36330 [Bacillus safensis]